MEEPIYTPLDSLEELSYKIHNYRPIGRVLAIKLSQIADRVGDINNNILFVNDHAREPRELIHTREDERKELQTALAAAVNGHECFNEYLDDLGV